VSLQDEVMRARLVKSLFEVIANIKAGQLDSLFVVGVGDGKTAKLIASCCELHACELLGRIEAAKHQISMTITMCEEDKKDG